MTNKIRIQNVKTGKIAEVTTFAWNTLKKGGKSKFYEVLNKPSEPVKFSAPKVVETIAAEPEPEIVDSYVDETEVMDETESNGVESAPIRKKGRKPKN